MYAIVSRRSVVGVSLTLGYAHTFKEACSLASRYEHKPKVVRVS